MANHRVRGHDRYTASGKTRVRTHSRNADAWREAGRTWALTAASGATSIALVLNMGFQLVSSIAIIVTAILAVVAGKATQRAAQGPKRRTASSGSRARSKPKAKAQSGLGPLMQHIERKQARRRAKVRKWTRRGKKAYRVSRTVVAAASRWGRAAVRRGQAAYQQRKANRGG